MMTTQQKLDALRALMAKSQVKAVYVTGTDPHQSEAPAAHWKAVQWLTGFTGSMGFAVVTQREAAFWTDGRYFEQAKREIDPAFRIFQFGLPETPDWTEWMSVPSRIVSSVGLDGSVLSKAEFRSIQKRLGPEVALRCDCSFVSSLWIDRPALPESPVWPLESPYAAESGAEKLSFLNALLGKNGCDAVLCCGLDDIAWLTNLRGDDHPLYPVFHAYALIHENPHNIEEKQKTLFLDRQKLTEDLHSELEREGWTVEDYEAVDSYVAMLPRKTTLWVDPYKTPVSLFDAAAKRCNIREGLDPITTLKARKSPDEQKNIREANRLEGAAAVRLICWIKENADSGVTEYEIGQKLEEFRKMSPLYLHPANIPIVGYGPNAALPHYRPTRENAAVVQPKGFVLFDVCAQYLCGTTDITRTVKVGPLTEEEKRDYTLTLKAHIRLARQRFPYGATGNLLDAVAKSLLWNKGVTFHHGTGHGIGYMLNIHEGPAKIITEYAPAFPYAWQTPLEDGMLFSNEPGIYRPGRSGIRLENSILVHDDIPSHMDRYTYWLPEKDSSNEFGRFLHFETVTYIPFEREAILIEDLTEDEIAWINSYHAETIRRLTPLLNDEEAQWLQKAASPL